MGDTIKEFLMFISDNPLMLCLCGAIVLLFIILIIVLFAGGKKEKKSEDVKLENTSELFTTKVDTENLKSTSELNVQTIKEAETPAKIAVPESKILPEENVNLEETLDLEYNEEEAPININDALNLKKEREVVPSIENTTITPKQLDDTDIIPIPVELNKAASTKLDVKADSLEKPIVFQEVKNDNIPEIKDFFTTPKKETPVIPDSINDESKAMDETINKLIDEVNLIKTGQIDINKDSNKIDKMLSEVNEVKTKSLNLDPLSNAEMSYKIDSLITDLNSFKPKDIDLPKQNDNVVKESTNIFDKVGSTGPISRTSSLNKVPDLVDTSDDLDDVELPMLKTEETSPLNILKGESFNLD